MVRNIDYIAAIESEQLASALKQRCNRVRIVSGKIARKIEKQNAANRRTVYFLENPSNAMLPTNQTVPEVRYALSWSGRLERIPIPPGVVEVLQGKTPVQLAKIVVRLIDSLEATAEQRILCYRKRGVGRLDVLFLDGECYTLNMHTGYRWDNVWISPDLHYLVVLDQDGDPRTIPWDEIRQPESHLDELRRTQQRLAEVLLTLRKSAGLSQVKAAQKSRLSRMTIHRLEKGGNYPGVATLKSLAKAYGVSLEDLLAELRT